MTQKKHTFKYFAPQARSCFLAGCFNGWSETNTPLDKDKDGYWKIELSLEPGRYEYRYIVDGIWENEQDPVEMIPNPFGSWNCVIEIKS